MIDEQPEQVGSSQELNPSALQHPLSQSDQANTQQHRQADADVQGQTLLVRTAAGAGNRRKCDGIIRRENEFQHHQHRQ